MILQKWIYNENWFEVVNVFSFLSLSENINLRTNISLGNFWELSLNVVGKSSKFLDINRFTSCDVITNILDQSFPDDDVLSFWLKRFQVRCSSLSGLIVLSWVLGSIL